MKFSWNQTKETFANLRNAVNYCFPPPPTWPLGSLSPPRVKVNLLSRGGKIASRKVAPPHLPQFSHVGAQCLCTRQLQAPPMSSSSSSWLSLSLPRHHQRPFPRGQGTLHWFPILPWMKSAEKVNFLQQENFPWSSEQLLIVGGFRVQLSWQVLMVKLHLSERISVTSPGSELNIRLFLYIDIWLGSV